MPREHRPTTATTPPPGSWQSQAAPHQQPPPAAAPPAPTFAIWPDHPEQPPAAESWPHHSLAGRHQPRPTASGPAVPYRGFPPPSSLPPRRNRTPLIIGVATAVVVAVVAVVGIVSSSGNRTNDATHAGTGTSSTGPSDYRSASDTVKAYLEALSSGDAAKALSLGYAEPPNTRLLTDAILHRQLAKMPISHIRILREDKALAGLGQATVHMAVTLLGEVVDDVDVDLKLDADRVWKLETAAAQIDAPLGTNKGSAGETVSLFGTDFTNGPLYVFPGYLDIGSSNHYLTASAKPVLLEGLRTYTSTNLDPDISLNDDGRRAINDQLAATFAACQNSTLLQPPNCPSTVGFPDAVEGTVTRGVADLSGVEIGTLSTGNMTVLLGGRARIPLSYRTTSESTKQGIAIAFMAGTADITTAPPALNLH